MTQVPPNIAYCPAEQDPELIQEIGRITVRHAMLEALMGDLIGRVLGVRVNESGALVAHLGLKAKLEMASSLIHEMEVDGPKKQYLLAVISQAEQASKARNVFTHQIIGYANQIGDGLYAHQNTARGGPLQVRKKSVSSSKAQEVAMQLGAINLSLVRAVVGDKPWADNA